MAEDVCSFFIEHSPSCVQYELGASPWVEKVWFVSGDLVLDSLASRPLIVAADQGKLCLWFGAQGGRFIEGIDEHKEYFGRHWIMMFAMLRFEGIDEHNTKYTMEGVG